MDLDTRTAPRHFATRAVQTGAMCSAASAFCISSKHASTTWTTTPGRGGVLALQWHFVLPQQLRGGGNRRWSPSVPSLSADGALVCEKGVFDDWVCVCVCGANGLRFVFACAGDGPRSARRVRRHNTDLDVVFSFRLGRTRPCPWALGPMRVIYVQPLGQWGKLRRQPLSVGRRRLRNDQNSQRLPHFTTRPSVRLALLSHSEAALPPTGRMGSRNQRAPCG